MTTNHLVLVIVSLLVIVGMATGSVGAVDDRIAVDHLGGHQEVSFSEDRDNPRQTFGAYPRARNPNCEPGDPVTNVTVTREGDTVQITGCVNVTGPNMNTTVTISLKEGGLNKTFQKNESGPFVERVDISEFVQEPAAIDLYRATVEVIHNGTTIKSTTLDLRVIEFGSLDTAKFENGNLTIRLKSALGIKSRSKVGIVYGSDKLNGTIRRQDENVLLWFDPESASRETLLSPTSLTVTAASNDLQLSERKLTVDAREIASRQTEFRIHDGDFYLSNPLFTELPASTEYTSQIRNFDGEVIYANGTAVVTNQGLVSLPDEFAFGPQSAKAGSDGISVSIWIADSEEQIVQRARYQPGSISVTLSGETLTLSTSTPAKLSAVIYQNQEGIYYSNLTSQGGQEYNITDGTGLATANEVLLVDTRGRIYETNLSSSGVETDEDGLNPPSDETPREGTPLKTTVLKLSIPLVFGFLFAFIFETILPTKTKSSGHDSTSRKILLGTMWVLFIGGVAFVFNFLLALTPFGMDHLTVGRVDLRNSLPIVGMGMVGGVIWTAISRRMSGGRSTGSSDVSAVKTVDVTIELQTVEGESITQSAEVEMKKLDELNHPTGHQDTRSVTNGRVRFNNLELGRWKAKATVGTIEKEQEMKLDLTDGGSQRITLEFPRPRLRVEVHDGRWQRPLMEASVSVRADAQTFEGRTNEEGICDFTLDYTVSGGKVSVTAPKYQKMSKNWELQGEGITVTVTLPPKTGSLSVGVSVDGTAIRGVPVKATPLDKPKTQARHRDGASSENGEIRFEDLMVGRYAIDAQLDKTVFDLSGETVEVTENELTSCQLSATFRWSLSSEYRQRIQDLRTEIESLANRRRQDVAIPRYYGSVVTSLLGTVEEIPKAGHLFVRSNYDPNELTEGLLDTAETGLKEINRATKTKDNIDLFVACSDLPEVDVQWDGTFDLEEIFERLDGELTSQRNDLAGRLEAVNTRIEKERSELAEMEPVETMWERSRDLYREAGRMDHGPAILLMYLIEAILDAIEQLFEHTPLRERLEKTVF